MKAAAIGLLVLAALSLAAVRNSTGDDAPPAEKVPAKSDGAAKDSGKPADVKESDDEKTEVAGMTLLDLTIPGVERYIIEHELGTIDEVMCHFPQVLRENLCPHG